MRTKDSEAWAEAREANPPPDGYGYDPREWPENLSDNSEQHGRGYGACVIFFAQVWAEEMEERMVHGAGVEDVAKASASYADHVMGRWGVTGFQYGAAVNILSQVWEHGEELRRWHNIDTQIDHEGEAANADGGVLNPAVIGIRTKDS
jgi:hypothetical protein